MKPLLALATACLAACGYPVTFDVRTDADVDAAGIDAPTPDGSPPGVDAPASDGGTCGADGDPCMGGICRGGACVNSQCYVGSVWYNERGTVGGDTELCEQCHPEVSRTSLTLVPGSSCTATTLVPNGPGRCSTSGVCCAGCFVGGFETCHQGNSDAYCGNGGYTCEACAVPTLCSSGACSN